MPFELSSISIETLRLLLTTEIARNAISTIVFLLVVTFARMFTLRYVRSSTLTATEIRRWIVQIRNATALIIIFGIIVIWAAELRTVALSLVAIAAAIVLATKEIITCFTGGILRTSSRAFQIGDRIEIGTLRGDVVDQSLLTTTIFEIGPGKSNHQYTGRAITIPNSVFLTTAVVNESFTDEYVLHLFSLPLKQSDDWNTFESYVLQAANEECAEFLDAARTHMNRISRSRGLEAPNIDPRIYLNFPTPDIVELLVRIPVPARRKGRIEQSILRRYIELKALKSSDSKQHPAPPKE